MCPIGLGLGINFKLFHSFIISVLIKTFNPGRDNLILCTIKYSYDGYYYIVTIINIVTMAMVFRKN